ARVDLGAVEQVVNVAGEDAQLAGDLPGAQVDFPDSQADSLVHVRYLRHAARRTPPRLTLDSSISEECARGALRARLKRRGVANWPPRHGERHGAGGLAVALAYRRAVAPRLCSRTGRFRRSGRGGVDGEVIDGGLQSA